MLNLKLKLKNSSIKRVTLSKGTQGNWRRSMLTSIFNKTSEKL